MVFQSTTLRRAVTVSAATIAFSLSSVLAAMAQSITLNGAGATFPKPLYDRYFAEYNKKNPEIRVNYEGIGSGGGIKQMIAGTVDFGGSDAAMTDEEIAKVDRGVLMIPTAGGAVAVVYNLPGVSSLKISRSVLPDIFMGKITRWNDARLVKDNPGVKLPDKPIRVVVRSDGSGTSFIFSNHLSAVSSGFKSEVGTSKEPKWPGNPLSGKGNPGVAALVQQTEGAIGYVEAAFAKEGKLTSALVQNKAGKFVPPTVEAANQALASIQFPANFRVFEGDPAGGYPIVGLTWLLVYKQYDSAKADAIKKLVAWILTDGQKINNSLEYTQVPKNTALKAVQNVNSNIASK